jgi:beta-lactamase class A
MTWDAITQLLDDAPGHYSLCVFSGDGDRVFGYEDRVLRSAASLIKVPLAMATIDLPGDLDALIPFDPADRVEGDGPFDLPAAEMPQAGSDRVSIRELLTHALTRSDNTASNLLIEHVGIECVNGWIAKRDLETRLRRRFVDFAALAAGRDNTTSAADMCALFAELQQPRYAFLIELLGRAVGDRKLEAGLPPGTLLAHKVGNLDDPIVEHDAGIVFGPGGPYIIAALAVDLPDVASGRNTIARVSRMVWELRVRT